MLFATSKLINVTFKISAEILHCIFTDYTPIMVSFSSRNPTLNLVFLSKSLNIVLKKECEVIQAKPSKTIGMLQVIIHAIYS